MTALHYVVPHRYFLRVQSHSNRHRCVPQHGCSRSPCVLVTALVCPITESLPRSTRHQQVHQLRRARNDRSVSRPRPDPPPFALTFLAGNCSFIIFMFVWGYLRHYQNIRMLWSVYTEFELVPAYARVWSPAEGFYLPPIMQYILPLLLSNFLLTSSRITGPKSSSPSSSSNSCVLQHPPAPPSSRLLIPNAGHRILELPHSSYRCAHVAREECE